MMFIFTINTSYVIYNSKTKYLITVYDLQQVPGKNHLNTVPADIRNIFEKKN